MKINIKRYKVKEKMKRISTQVEAINATREKAVLIGSVDAAGNVSFSANPVAHDKWDTNGVRAELKRLARENPGKMFISVQMVGAELVIPQPNTLSV